MTLPAYQANADFDRSHWWFLGRNAILCAVARRFLGNLKLCSVLDYGCGTGGVSESLAPYFQNYFCFEPSREGSEICCQRGLSVYTTPTELRAATPGGVDVVFCLDVLEHVSDDAALLREAFAQVSPGGLGFVTVPAYDWLWGAEDEISNHLRRYRNRSLRSAIDRADLEILMISGFNTILLPLQAAVVFASRNSKQTNLKAPGRLQQLICLTILKIEAWWLTRFSLPVGASLLAVVRKRG